ncbi:hypothetical protein CAPTEDRAFT_195399 [Capitella teleta]|uniref:Uncharacterized protein n=1 Tax=Capitella teleta TaxID=283909 RepID=R7VDK1_CAPTE|nr:hypothetical protein CAPTEDRAFT_195399 [Capitella teleta]|eukprot:ELU16642.1 hypothetical protein CAPTEDRAFT_195399 [Capitella teleta]
MPTRDRKKKELKKAAKHCLTLHAVFAAAKSQDDRNLSSRLEEPALVANLSVLNLQAVDADCRTLHGFEDLTALANNFGLDVDEVQDEWMRFKASYWRESVVWIAPSRD